MRTTAFHHFPWRPLVLLAGMLHASFSYAQKQADPFDTLYVNDYSHILTGRAYFSTKNNAFALRTELGKDLVYRPNNQINWGLGASYRSLTLNIGIRMPLVNDNDDEFGRTRYLDAQANILTKRTATNLFLQVFSGYHLGSHVLSEVNWPALAQRPYRPDVYQFNIGFSSLRITNNDRFSYRASFNQDAWQKRSQGSWLFGGYATFFGLRSDSSLVPSILSEQYTPELNLRRGNLFDAGPMGGYVYTFVHKEHWFATLSTVLGGGLAVRGLTHPDADSEREVRTVDAGAAYRVQLRAGMGYNSARHYVGISYNQERIGHLLNDQQRFTWNVSNLRFNIVKRFDMRVKFMDNGIRWLKKRGPSIMDDVLPPEPDGEPEPE